MGYSAPLRERRRADRPQTGDLKLCPKCRLHNCEFNPRYRFPDGAVGPAWLCEAAGCGFREMVRSTPGLTGHDLVRQSRDVQAVAQRKIMKSRSKTARSLERIAATETRVRKNS